MAISRKIYKKVERSIDPINENIDKNQMKVIGYDGTQHGILSKSDAIILSKQEELDLVLVSDKEGQIPVARIMDYGRYKFEKSQKKKTGKKKDSSSHTKSKRVQMRYLIDIGDKTTKVNMIDQFLKKGYTVEVEIYARGRERQNLRTIGKRVLNEVLSMICSPYKVIKQVDSDNKYIRTLILND